MAGRVKEAETPGFFTYFQRSSLGCGKSRQKGEYLLQVVSSENTSKCSERYYDSNHKIPP